MNYTNIGIVEYIKNFKTGIMVAKWNFMHNENIICGTGIANGPQNDKYEGNYEIQYYDEDGEKVGLYNLIIKNDSKRYLLNWYQDNELKCYGVGLLSDNKLIAGWKKKES
ncbi:MAG: hypothetical protein KKB59_19260 [Spirochaetes bacterium]|nr:hypothetical protein [Spirochaetota bacterium]